MDHWASLFPVLLPWLPERWSLALWGTRHHGDPCLGSSPNPSQSPSSSFPPRAANPHQHQLFPNHWCGHKVCKGYWERSKIEVLQLDEGHESKGSFHLLLSEEQDMTEVITFSSTLPREPCPEPFPSTVYCYAAVCMCMCILACLPMRGSYCEFSDRHWAYLSWGPHCLVVTLCWPTLQKTAELASWARPKVYFWQRVVCYEQASPKYQTS